MKTVLLCIDTLSTAGAQRFVTELASNLDVGKYVPVVVVTNRLDKESVFYRKLNAKGIDVIDVSSRNLLKETVKIVTYMKKTNAEIIHSNVGAVFYVMLAQLICGYNGHHLFTVHSMGYRIFYGLKKSLIKLFFHCGWIMPVAICDTVKKSMIEAYDLKDRQIECVYNGIDTDIFKPIANKKEEHCFTVVSVGSMYDLKNQKLLIEAFSILHERNEDTRLSLVGNGELRSELEKQVVKLRLGDVVAFQGKQSDVSSYLNDADVYCCTSKVEGLPLSVLEAMACGLPVISTPAGGVVDIVKSGVNGYIVNPDAEEIALKLEILMHDQQLRESMSANSRDIAVSINIKECAREYEQLYDKYSK